MHRMSVAALLILAACGPKKAPRASAEATAALEALRTHAWHEICPGSDPLQTTLRFREDGRFDFQYPGEQGFAAGDDETWVVEGPRLTVTWNGGFATSTYDLDRFDGQGMPGESSKSCGTEIRLERAGAL